MSLIIENGKVIRANGTMDQIIDDFNEYLEFIRETTIPVPKEQFNNLSENRTKLYGDYIEAIKANKDLQEEIKNLKHMHILNALENNKEASTIIAKRAAEIDKLKSAYNEVETKLEQFRKDKEKTKDNISVSYKNGDLAFIIHRAWVGPIDDETVIHITLAIYNGFTWGSLEGHVVETDCADIVLIESANYLRDYFGTPNVSCAVRYHY